MCSKGPFDDRPPARPPARPVNQLPIPNPRGTDNHASRVSNPESGEKKKNKAATDVLDDRFTIMLYAGYGALLTGQVLWVGRLKVSIGFGPGHRSQDPSLKLCCAVQVLYDGRREKKKKGPRRLGG